MKKLEEVKGKIVQWWQDSSTPKKVFVIATAVTTAAVSAYIVYDRVMQNNIMNDIDLIGDLDSELSAVSNVITSM